MQRVLGVHARAGDNEQHADGEVNYGRRMPVPMPMAVPLPPAVDVAPRAQECQICLDDLRRDLMAGPCGHVFHAPCILQAIRVNRQCPTCRGRTTRRDLIRLYFDVPDPTECGTSSSAPCCGRGEVDDGDGGHAQERVLQAQLGRLLEKLQWHSEQRGLLFEDNQRLRDQNMGLQAHARGLQGRIGELEAAKDAVLAKLDKCQLELQRQAQIARQMSVNQSLIDYLNTGDSDALEAEVTNPRELVATLKKACKYRHDQYEKIVKEKARLTAMVQQLQDQQRQQQQSQPRHHAVRRAAVPPLEHFSGEDAYAYEPDMMSPHPVNMKKRRISTSPTGVMVAPEMPLAHLQQDAGYAQEAGAMPTFRASAYTDVNLRNPNAARAPRTGPAVGLGRSAFNPNQYGMFNLTPSSDAPVQQASSQRGVCRRGYDDTGKLTNFFVPKEVQRSMRPAHGGNARINKAMPTLHSFLAPPAQGTAFCPRRAVATSSANAAQASSLRQEYSLTNWLEDGQ